MIQTRQTITIDRSAEDVFAFLTQLEKYPLWQSGLFDVEVDGPVELGTKARGTSSNLGIKINVGVEVIECSPPETLVIESRLGPLNFNVRYELIAQNSNKTKLTCTTQVDAAGVYSVAEPVMEHMGNVKLKSDLASLKILLEEQQKLV